MIKGCPRTVARRAGLQRVSKQGMWLGVSTNPSLAMSIRYVHICTARDCQIRFTSRAQDYRQRTPELKVSICEC
jgi:hypothetical protein